MQGSLKSIASAFKRMFNRKPKALIANLTESAQVFETKKPKAKRIGGSKFTVKKIMSYDTRRRRAKNKMGAKSSKLNQKLKRA
jgi:hypothetical protein